MQRIVLTVLSLILAAGAYGQSGRTYSSIGGFGNVVYPGTGHAPNVNPGPPPSFANRLGNNIVGARNPLGPPRVSHPGHGRTQIVPYPVIYGPGYYGYGSGYGDAPAQGYGDAGSSAPIVNTNSAPSVVINQTFIPDRANPVMREYGNSPDAAMQPQDQQGMRMYEGLKTQPQTRSSDEPTLYLIALKDHSVVQALGYWVEGANLHYVSVEHTLNQVSLDLIDRSLSQRLNDERNVEFKLPKA